MISIAGFSDGASLQLVSVVFGRKLGKFLVGNVEVEAILGKIEVERTLKNGRDIQDNGQYPQEGDPRPRSTGVDHHHPLRAVRCLRQPRQGDRKRNAFCCMRLWRISVVEAMGECGRVSFDDEWTMGNGLRCAPRKTGPLCHRLTAFISIPENNVSLGSANGCRQQAYNALRADSSHRTLT